MTSVFVRGMPWKRRTEGLYVQVRGRTYNGYPVYQRRDNKGRRWSLYHKNWGMWVLDFNRVSPWWSGTVAFSSPNPDGDGGVLDAEWPLFEDVRIEPAASTPDSVFNVQQEQSRLGTQPQLVLFILNTSLLVPNGDMDDSNYTEEDEEDDLIAEGGDLMTIAEPSFILNGTLPEDASSDGHTILAHSIVIIASACAAILIVLALAVICKLYVQSRKAKRLATGKAGSSTKGIAHGYSATDMVEVSIVSPPTPCLPQETFGVHGPFTKI